MIVHLKHSDSREEHLTRSKITFSNQYFKDTEYPSRIVVVFVDKIEQFNLGFRITVGKREFSTSFDSIIKVV